MKRDTFETGEKENCDSLDYFTAAQARFSHSYNDDPGREDQPLFLSVLSCIAARTVARIGEGRDKHAESILAHCGP